MRLRLAGRAALVLALALAASPARAYPIFALPPPPPPPAEAEAPDTGAPAPETPAPPVEAPPDAPPSAATETAQTALPTVPPPLDLATRLDEVEQLARIADRRAEILEEEAAKRAKEAPAVTADDGGFALKQGGAYLLKLRALLQADSRFFFYDDGLQANDTFLLRRFRPSLEGTLFSLVDYRLLPELAGTVQILDGYVDVHPVPWLRLRVGKYKGPIGLERLQSDADLPLLERALDQNLSSQREVGVQIWGDVAGGILQYAIAVFNGAVEGASGDTDINHAKDLAGRIFVQPFRTEGLKALGSLGFGFAAQAGNRKGRLPTATAAAVTGLPIFRTAGQNTFFQYIAPAGDTTGAQTTFAHELQVHLNPQLYYYYEALGLLVDYVRLRQGVQRGNTTGTLTHQAAHATLSYAVAGRVGYDGVTPLARFDPAAGNWGAVEIAVRVGWLKADPASFGDPNVAGSVQYADPARSARSARSWAAGLGWVPRRSFHLAVNFEQTTFTGGAGTAAAVVDRKTENVLITRAQVNF